MLTVLYLSILIIYANFIGTLIRIINTIDLFSFHGIFPHDFQNILFFSSAGLWVSSFAMLIGVWIEIMTGTKKLHHAKSLKRAVYFCIGYSIFAILCAVVVVATIFIPEYFDLGAAVATFFSFMGTILSFSVGGFISYQVRIKKQIGIDPSKMRKQSNAVIFLGVIQLSWILVGVSILFIRANYKTDFEYRNYAITFCHFISRIGDILFPALLVYILVGYPWDMRKGKDLDGSNVVNLTTGSSRSNRTRSRVTSRKNS
eukprot:TRINITY_DN4456_c0_g1_i1.p1 TRINITY_DN4456_c0_g1~~TRINITY_DN4456_c0_g1_i1.p1  ORF type:complete len:258 (+),score=21.72 TRINITY_DN4456_c0_g1_i1:175-948(+)